METSNSDDFDFQEFFDLDGLAMQDHEPQNPLPLGISQFGDGAFGKDDQSQPSHDNISIGAQQPLTSPDSNGYFFENYLDPELRRPVDQSSLPLQEIPSPSPHTPWSTQSESPRSSNRSLEDAQNGKKRICPAKTTHICRHCNESFATMLLYR